MYAALVSVWGERDASLPLVATGDGIRAVIKEQIVGAWRIVSIYNEQNGVKQNLYGDKPVGLTVFDRSDYVIQYLSKAGVPTQILLEHIRSGPPE
jgi:hypothetical protein